MNKLLDSLKRFLPKHHENQGDSLAVNTNVETSVETHKQEVQGFSKKVSIKDNGAVIVDSSTKNITFNLNINTVPTNPDERAELISVIREAFNNKEIRGLVSESANKTIQDYNQNPIEESAKAAMEYMAKIAPELDILCMETGLYVRTLDNRGMIDSAKEIRDKASKTPRARNIINLASAGFIEGYVVPVCQADENNAKKIYDEIVEELPGIVFVNASMDVSRTMEIIEKKMNDRAKYHWEINSILVTGLNSCMGTISDVREKIKEKYPNLRTSYTATDEPSFSRGELKINLEIMD